MNEHEKKIALDVADDGPIYAFRRKGLDEFVTCDAARYAELSQKPNLFQMAIFYRHPKPK